LEPKPTAQEMIKLLELHMEQEKLRDYFEQAKLELKNHIEPLGMELRANLTIAEENQRLNDAVAAELGGQWPALWHDPLEAVCTEELWESSFLSSLVELTKIPLLSPSHCLTDYSQNPLSHECSTSPVICVNSSERSSSSASTASPLRFRVPNMGSPNNFPGNPGTAYDPVSIELRPVADPEPGSRINSVQTETPGMDSAVQKSLRFDESGQRFPGISLEEETVPDQPSLNQSPMPRILPPEVTTLVVQNVPARFSPQKLMEVWSPDGTYNLLHVPYGFQRKRRHGIAFINFVSHEAATHFMATWHGQRLVDGSKRLLICAAEVQGVTENLRRFKAQDVQSLRYLPVVLDGTRQLDSRALLAHIDLGHSWRR